MALYPWVAAVCVRMFGGNLKGVQRGGDGVLFRLPA